MYTFVLLDRAVKTLQSSIRLWLTVVLISAGFMSAIWAVAPGGGGSSGVTTFDDCWAEFWACNRACTTKFRGARGYYARQTCYGNCDDRYYRCMKGAVPSKVGGGATGQTQPPNKTGPNSTPTPAPTPRRLPTRPPKRLGPSPTPSATAKPILLAKPKPTPSPKPTPKKSTHGHN
jgi:hypothetical protein